MLFKKNKKEKNEHLSDEVKRYEDLYRQNQELLERLLKETTINITATKGA
jgi:hypothetical protein